MNEKFEPIPLDMLLNNLYFQFQVTMPNLSPPEEIKKIASIIWWLEKCKELQNSKVERQASEKIVEHADTVIMDSKTDVSEIQM